MTQEQIIGYIVQSIVDSPTEDERTRRVEATLLLLVTLLRLMIGMALHPERYRLNHEQALFAQGSLLTIVNLIAEETEIEFDAARKTAPAEPLQ